MPFYRGGKAGLIRVTPRVDLTRALLQWLLAAHSQSKVACIRPASKIATPKPVG